MASSAPRHGYPGHPQGPPDALAAGIQNLYVTRPNAPVTRPPSFAGAGSSPMPIARTDAPTYAPPLRGVSPPPFVTGNIGPGRPMGFAQPPPPAASRPGPFSASPPSSGPTAISNGPAAFVPPGSRFPPTVQGPPGLARGPPPPGVRPMADSQNVPGILPQVQQSRAPFLGGSQGVPGPMMQPQATPFVGASHASVAPPMQAAPAPFSGGQSGSPTMRPPAPPFLGATQSVPPLMQAPPAPFMGSSQPMPPPMQQPPPPFVGGSQVMPPPPPPTSLPYGSQPWPSQLAQTPQVPVLGGSMQTPRMYSPGAPPPPNQPVPLGPPGMGHPPGTGLLGMTRAGSPVGASPMAGASKIDPTQMPRPLPTSSMITFETRQNNQANLPPPATSDYVARDTGNCSPRYMRCTMNQIPCTSDLLSTSSMPLALLVQPLAFPHPLEEPIQVVDFGEGGPVRCSRCKGYINPFMKFIDHGKHFICNLCGFTDETPRDYYCNLGPDSRRRDADERPELCRGTVEFVASKEYMVRDPMPAVFFFLVDVSMNAIQSGATAAACSAVAQSINDLPQESPRTMVGFATYDSTVQFYNLKRHLQQPLMLIVPDVQDVYTPLETDLIVQLSECRQHLEQLLDNIPTMFQNNKVPESAFGAAVKGAFLAMKSTGGKLLVFHSVLPSVGIGSLSAREVEGRANVSAGEKEAHKLLQPADKTLKTMAIEFAEHQVCVDLFATTQSYVDIASLSVIPRTTGGQVYYYYPFSAVSDSAKLYNDLRWNITRPQGFEAVMRVRCSQGLQVQEYFGNFCKRIPTDVDLPAIDCDKTIMVTFKHDDKFQDGAECAFQCALLYTTVYGQRRIRVTTLSLPCTSVLSNLFRAADLDAQFTCFLKQAGNDIPTTPLVQVRDQVTNLCINILSSYRKFCATVSSSGQLILPEALKLLPLYTLALVKSVGLRVDGRIDERSYWISHVASLSASSAVPLVYPRMLPIHTLTSKAVIDQETNDSLMPPPLPLSSEHITDNGIFLLENGEDCLVYIGNSVNPDILQQLFGVSSVDSISNQFLLQQFDNELSRKLNEVVNYIRRQRCSYLRFRLCRKGEPSGHLFFSYMVEDKTPAGLSYVEFLVHIHRQIQTKMS
ncbi:protein transport protein Sec24-like At4g32640 isoform X1 [Nymphaea colorata]|nr:protein transport protein Sec24-like At4g32640 isoform X1 [Nymphaea colorata]